MKLKFSLMTLSFSLFQLLTACKGSSSTAIEGPASTTFLVPDSASSSVQFYDAVPEGNTYPTRVIFGAATQLDEPTSVAYSENYDELYVCDTGEDAIFSYKLSDVRQIDDLTGPGANIPPLDIIKGLATGISNPTKCRVNDNELYVLDSNRILVFSLSSFARGSYNNTMNLSPVRELDGGTTNPLVAPKDFVFSGNKIFISSDNEIHIFQKTIGGSVEPTRILTDTDGGPNAFNHIRSLYKYYNLLYVLNENSSGDFYVTSYYYVDDYHSGETSVELSAFNSHTGDEYQENPVALSVSEQEEAYHVLNIGAVLDTSSISTFSRADSGAADPTHDPLMGDHVQLVTPTDMVELLSSLID